MYTEQANQAFLNVLNAMKEISYLNDEVSRTANEQNTVSESIAKDINEISSSSSRNNAHARDTKLAADKLGRLANEMDELLGEFKV